ncbi:MAG TPA: hypothetical protein VMZ04_10845 [Anaerolineae bacterium]|nr:hypothetical protein [Anaerolineae bacterium]
MNNRNILHFLKFHKSNEPVKKIDLKVLPPGDTNSTDGSEFMENMRKIDGEFEDYWRSLRTKGAIG